MADPLEELGGRGSEREGENREAQEREQEKPEGLGGESQGVFGEEPHDGLLGRLEASTA